MILDLKELINKYDLKINGVFHVGAHHGQEINAYKELGIKNIAMVEPQPGCQKILEERFSNDDEVVLFKCAVGSDDSLGKTLSMYTETANAGQSSSLLEPELHLIQHPGIRFNGTLNVDMSTVDTLTTELKSPENYNFLNMDVQGYELEVLKGSTKHLNNVDYIMTEVNRAEVYKDCALIRELDAFLSEYQFKRVETNWAGTIWGDAFYIKEAKND